MNVSVGEHTRVKLLSQFEVVHYKLQDDKKGKLDAQSAIGVWIGKSLNSDEHYLGTPDGIRRCRSIWRGLKETVGQSRS